MGVGAVGVLSLSTLPAKGTMIEVLSPPSPPAFLGCNLSGLALYPGMNLPDAFCCARYAQSFDLIMISSQGRQLRAPPSSCSPPTSALAALLAGEQCGFVLLPQRPRRIAPPPAVYV